MEDANLQVMIVDWQLNKEYDPDDKYHIVRAIDHFQYHGHLCIVFELLTENL